MEKYRYEGDNPLTGFLQDLNEEVKRFPNCAIVGRDAEIKRIWTAMMKESNPVVIIKGNSGVGKTAIVQKMAYELEKGNCPEVFKGFKIVMLDMKQVALVQDYNEKMMSEFAQLADEEKLIFGVDSLEYFFRLSPEKQQMFIEIVKMAVSSKNRRCFAIITNEAYIPLADRYMVSREMFEVVDIAEMQEAEVFYLLQNTAKSMEKFHGVRVSKAMLRKIVLYASCFRYDEKNPRRSIELLETSMIMTKLEGKHFVDERVLKDIFRNEYQRFYMISEAERLKSAYHEIGHYAVRKFSGRMLNKRVTAVTIIPTERSKAANIFESTGILVNADRDYIIDEIAAKLAGKVAEEIFCNEQKNAGTAGDTRQATEIAYQMVMEYGMGNTGKDQRIYLEDENHHMMTWYKKVMLNFRIKMVLKEATKRAKNLIVANKVVVEGMAKELFKKGLLRGDELEAIIQRNQRK